MKPPQRGQTDFTIMQMSFWPRLKGESIFNHRDVLVRVGWETFSQTCFYMFQMPLERKPRFAMGFTSKDHAIAIARRRIDTLKGAQS